MSSFRASPWVSYEPTSSSHHNRQQDPSESDMDDDVDMDAPQISTLREEESPPPTQVQKKVATTPKKRPAPPPAPPSVKSGKQQDEFDEEDQLDELIDDDDNENPAKPSPSQPGRATDAGQKRKVSAKRKPRKSDKIPADGPKEKKVKERIPQQMGAHLLAPTMSWFKATPAESHEDTDTPNGSHQPAESSASAGKKKVSPRKPPTIPRAKLKLTKQKSAIPPLLLEDAGTLSESYAGTAASSPVTAQFEQNSPEPENMPPSSPPLVSAPLPEEGSQEASLENVPLPVYPLPTKPFPVQPPPKIASGFAPLLPLDKSGRKVRHWREANREIRGIAGGRWLARTWVGDKESDYASFVSVTSAQIKPADDKTPNNMALPKLSSVSISAPATTKALGKLKSSKSASALTSANPSRASSSIPDTPSIPINGSAVRAPTKMRILQLAPSSEGGDSDMAPPNT